MIQQSHFPLFPYLTVLKAGSQRGVCTTVFIAALYIIAKKLAQYRCPSMDEWINKIWCVHTMEYYSALKRRGILMLATTRMNLEDILLSEIRQMQKGKCCVIPFI